MLAQPDSKANNDSLMDAANAVFLARDDYASVLPRKGTEWTGIVMDVQDVSEILEKKDIVMNTMPQETATGLKTYRILNNPSRSM